jgi:hypothetical protein
MLAGTVVLDVGCDAGQSSEVMLAVLNPEEYCHGNVKRYLTMPYPMIDARCVSSWIAAVPVFAVGLTGCWALFMPPVYRLGSVGELD